MRTDLWVAAFVQDVDAGEGTSLMDWLWAGVAIAAALIVGSFVSRVVRGLLDRETNPDSVQESAGAVASLVFSAFLVAGLMTALGFIKREALDQISDDLIDYLPRLISAGIVVILGNLAGTLAATAVAKAIGRSGGRVGEQIPGIVRTVIVVFTAILATTQLGVDTTVINIAVSALLFGLAGAMALIVGLGARDIATEIAAGRALRRILQPGDDLRSDDLTGKVLTVHSTAVELEVDGESLLIPNQQIASSRMAVVRNDPPDPTP